MPPVSGFPGTGGLIAYLFSVRLELADVYCTELLAVLRILLGIERNLLTLFQSLEALAYDCREMYEYVVAAVIVGDESVAFLRIEPLNCTVVHFGTSIIKIYFPDYFLIKLHFGRLLRNSHAFAIHHNKLMTYKNM